MVFRTWIRPATNGYRSGRRAPGGDDNLKGHGVQIDKDAVIDFLKSQGRHDDAAKAAHELPDRVDHERHSDLLTKFGINPKELLDKLPGGLGGKLGGLLGDK